MRAKQAEKRCKNKIRSEKFPHFFPQFGEEENKSYKTKPYIVFDLLNLIQYMVSVAGEG